MTAGFMHSICSSRCVHARTPRCTCTACGGAAHGTLPAEHAEQLELFAAEVIVPRRSSFPAAGPGEPDPQAGGPPIAGHRRTSARHPSLSHAAPDPAAAGPSSREAAGAGLGPIPQELVSSTLPLATNGNTGAGSMRKDLRTQPGLATPAGKQSHKKPDHSRGLRFAGDDRDETSGVPGVRQRQLAEENTSVSALQPSNLGHLAATDVPQQDVPGRHGRPANALPSDAPANPGPQGVPAPDAAGGAAPTIHSHPDPSSTHSTAAAPGSGGRPSRLCACGRRAKWGSTRCRICDPWKPLANLRGMAVHP